MTTPNFYTVEPGDSLSVISQRTGVSISELAKLNGVRNPNNIRAGRKLALTREAVCGVTVQMLDRDHNPIRRLPYVVRYCGKEVKGETNGGGQIPRIVTESPLDTVTILLRRPEGDLKEITTVVSGSADKLVTLVSPKLKIEAKTHRHPVEDAEKHSGSSASHRAAVTAENGNGVQSKQAVELHGVLQSWTGSPENRFGITVHEGKDVSGKPVAKVITSGDDEPSIISEAKASFKGDKISDTDWTNAANRLGCEKEVIMAIGFQESGKLSAMGIGAFDKQNRPTILFERHKFRFYTNGIYDAESPDLSSTRAYVSGTAKDKNNVQFDDGNHYGLFSWQYKKLAKAYKLDSNAALMACSWGKFQIMGFHFKVCGFSTVEAFVHASCISEREHLQALEAFLESKKLNAALYNKDWAAIAFGYNGSGYRKNNYDVELKAGYEKFVVKLL